MNRFNIILFTSIFSILLALGLNATPASTQELPYVKSLDAQQKADVPISKVPRDEREALAKRLDVSPDVFKEYPDFETFIRINYLFKSIPYFGHHIVIDPRTHMPSLLMENQITSWHDIQQLVETDKKGVLTNYTYTYEGLVPGSSSTHIRPFKKVDPHTYRGHYILEVVQNPNSSPPHVWIRLINPMGEVISAGFHPKDPIRGWIDALLNFGPSEGKVLSPDPFEISTGGKGLIETPIALSQDDYQKALKFLQEYQQDPNKCYQIIGIGGHNCANFVILMMDEAGIHHTHWGPATPYSIGFWQEKIRAWREQMIHALQGEHADYREQIEYAVPQEP